jgi:hypothetical protein
MMDRKTMCLCAALFYLINFFPIGISGAMAPPKQGGPFPDIPLAVPKEKMHRDYLGLQESGTFTISKVKAQVVIIEVFNMY